MSEEPVEQENNLDQERTEEKSQRIARVRQDLLNGAVSGRITNIRERIAFLLNYSIEARNSDVELTWLYWENFEIRFFRGGMIDKAGFEQLTKMNSLIRIRAKIQNEYKLFQANDTVKKFRGVLEEEKKQEVVEDKPSAPFYTIYIDETGKTQKYLSVGGLWIINTSESVISIFKLKDWIKARSITSEFHFVRVKDHNLESFKAFFLEFLVLYPSVGFKVIIVENEGITNTSNAITDLTFHLINKGVRHEHDSGRASLPRALQVRIDEEGKGSDKIKLENIQERIVSQHIEGLSIDSFEAINSKDNLYLQIVDLFVSSVNRKLHPPDREKKPKDELADYILDLLGFDIANLDKANGDVDKSSVFNLTYKKA